MELGSAVLGTDPTNASRSAVRKLLDELLKSDSELHAFCIDHFPDIERVFSDGMDRISKTNILLKHADVGIILTKLRFKYPNIFREEIKTHGTWSLVLSATLDEVNAGVATSIVEQLKQISGVKEITLKMVRNGSVKLILEGNREDFEKIVSALKERNITDISGFPIKALEWEKIDSVDIPPFKYLDNLPVEVLANLMLAQVEARKKPKGRPRSRLMSAIFRILEGRRLRRGISFADREPPIPFESPLHDKPKT